jgi:rhodanese-related sulfurtransferase
MKKFFFALALFTLQFSLGQKELDLILTKYNNKSIPYISVETLATSISETLLLDSREEEEYEISHIKGAVHVGYKQFNIADFIKNKPRKTDMIVIYCSLGVRSEIIGEKIKAAGYTNIKNLYGGIFEWKNKTYKVYNSNNQETDSIHVFSKKWGKMLNNGIKYYPKTKTNND